MRQLYLTRAETRWMYGKDSYNAASRFLDELPDDIADTILPKNFETRRGLPRKVQRRKVLEPCSPQLPANALPSVNVVANICGH